MIRKVVVNALLIISVAVLTFGKINRFIPGNVLPDILLILTVFNGIYNGSYFGMVFGFFSGLTLDILSWPVLGLHTFIYTIIGYSTALIEQRLDIQNPLISSVLISLEFLLKCILFLFVGLIFLEKGVVGNYFKHKFLIEMIYTVLLAIPVFLIFQKVHNMRRKMR